MGSAALPQLVAWIGVLVVEGSFPFAPLQEPGAQTSSKPPIQTTNSQDASVYGELVDFPGAGVRQKKTEPNPNSGLDRGRVGGEAADASASDPPGLRSDAGSQPWPPGPKPVATQNSAAWIQRSGAHETRLLSKRIGQERSELFIGPTRKVTKAPVHELRSKSTTGGANTRLLSAPLLKVINC